EERPTLCLRRFSSKSSLEIKPNLGVHRAHRSRAGHSPEQRRTQRRSQPVETRCVRQILHFPANINSVPCLRTEPECLCQRHFPIERAGSFNGPTPLVAILRRCRLNKRRGIKISERRSTANPQVRISSLIRAQ